MVKPGTEEVTHQQEWHQQRGDRLLEIHRHAILAMSRLKPLRRRPLPTSSLMDSTSKTMTTSNGGGGVGTATMIDNLNQNRRSERHRKLQERLAQLQRKRIGLAADAAAMQCQNELAHRETLGAELKIHQQQQEQRYPYSTGENFKFIAGKGQTRNDDTTTTSTENNMDMRFWHQIRMQQSIAAAYRLAGISLYTIPTTAAAAANASPSKVTNLQHGSRSSNENNAEILVVHFDIDSGFDASSCSTDIDTDKKVGLEDKEDADSKLDEFRVDNGKERTDPSLVSFQCYFDFLVEKHDSDPSNPTSTEIDSSGSLVLRLVQHTLPEPLPVAEIFHRHFGDDPRGDQQQTRTLMAEMGKWSYNAPTLNSHFNDADKSILNSDNFNRGIGNTVKIDGDYGGLHDNTSSGNGPTFPIRLRGFVHQTYHTCHAWHVRRTTFEYLQLFSSKTATEDAAMALHPPHIPSDCRPSTKSQSQRRLFSVDHVKGITSISVLKTIHFHLHHRLSGISPLDITLHYATDLCRPRAHQPVAVSIQLPGKTNRHANTSTSQRKRRRTQQPRSYGINVNPRVELVSDDEDQDNADVIEELDEEFTELVENASAVFRRFAIPEALQQVANSMADW